MNRSILVVEDDQAILDLVVDVLRDEGHDVAGAGDGAAAMAAIEQRRPDLIVLDMRMPVMNGWDFVRRLNERGLDIPILVMTAAQDARRWALEVGAVGYLAKPFDVDDLVRTVSRLLGDDHSGGDEQHSFLSFIGLPPLRWREACTPRWAPALP